MPRPGLVEAWRDKLDRASAVQRSLRPPAVVEGQIPVTALTGYRDAFIGAQVNLLVFDRPPQPVGKDVVAPCTFAVHANLDACVLQRLDKADGRELAALSIGWFEMLYLIVNGHSAEAVMQLRVPRKKAALGRSHRDRVFDGSNFAKVSY